MLSHFSSMNHDAKFRVMILDPNSDAARDNAQRIEAEGHEVVIVQTAAAALMQLETKPFDVLFCELFYPEQDGFEVCKSIAKVLENKAMPVPMMALTHTQNPEHIRLSYQSGAVNFVSKPLTLPKLHAAMSLLHHKQKKKPYFLPLRKQNPT